MSSRKNVLLPFTDPKISAQSMAASITGTPTNIQYLDNVGVQLSWTGNDPLGIIKVQVSLDYNPNTTNGTWTAIQTTPGTDLSVSPSGSAGNAYIDLNQLSAPWIRVVYTTAASSVGLLTAVIGSKQV